MKTSLFIKLLKVIKKHIPLVLCSLILSIVSVVCLLYIPLLIGDGIDLIMGENNVDFTGLQEILIKIVIITLICSVIEWIKSLINNYITYNVVFDLRVKTFSKIHKLPLKYLDNKAYGDIVNRVINDVDTISDGLLMGFTQFFTGLATIIGTLIFMITINVWIALIVVILTPISLFVAKYIATHTFDMFKKQSEVKAEQTSFVEEMIGNQKLIHAYNRQDDNQEVFDEINNRLEKVSLKAIFYSSLTNPSTRFVNNLVYASVCLSGALFVLSPNPITIGNLSTLLAYANQYTKPFNEISGVITELQNSMASFKRICDILEEEEEISDNTIALVNDEINSLFGRIDFNNVAFAYEKSRPLIENLNLMIPYGKKVAIVGPTGCGKTTLINLLMRFYDVNDGSIEVDGIDIRDLKRKSLRKSFGMVLQDTWIKSGTIKENIIMGKPDATMDEVIKASKATYADNFIRRLPNGYDTMINEDGGNLSSGQKQLLCITRIMLSMPPMLILDEATSNIDTRTEMLIQDAFNKLMKDKTSFIVAHRLSTIQNADIILVMKDGNVIEQGTHDELLKLEGFYYYLYNSQFTK